MAISYCRGCERTFAGIVAFDAHREGKFTRKKRRCLTEQEMRTEGMFRNEKGWWAVPSVFGKPEATRSYNGRGAGFGAVEALSVSSTYHHLDRKR
jgi:hypothetical protein